MRRPRNPAEVALVPGGRVLPLDDPPVAAAARRCEAIIRDLAEGARSFVARVTGP